MSIVMLCAALAAKYCFIKCNIPTSRKHVSQNTAFPAQKHTRGTVFDERYLKMSHDYPMSYSFTKIVLHLAS